MLELFSAQRDFAAALRDASRSDEAAHWLIGSPASVAARLAIYRGNIRAAAAKALAAAYPVVQQVVGAEFFGGLAQAYQRAHPSASGDLFDYGADVPVFFETFAPTQDLPYLADLARLEWAAHRASGAADAPVLDLNALAPITPEQQAALHVQLAAGTAIVASPYPIAELWRIHQADHTGEFKVDWSVAEHALVARQGFRVTVAAIDLGVSAFVAALLEDATLSDAVDAALAAQPTFDLSQTLAWAIQSQLICGFTLPETTP